MSRSSSSSMPPEDMVLADRIQIEQAMVNLIRNAIEAMTNSRERKLTISTVIDDGMIRTDVADTGPRSDRHREFRTLRAIHLDQVEWARRRPVDLAVDHRSPLRDDLGGANPGGGAKFSFTLPLARFEDAGS